MDLGEWPREARVPLPPLLAKKIKAYVKSRKFFGVLTSERSLDLRAVANVRDWQIDK